MKRGRVRLVLATAGIVSLAACQSQEQTATGQRPELELGRSATAPRKPQEHAPLQERARLSKEEEAFWFGSRGAPPPLGDPGPVPPLSEAPEPSEPRAYVLGPGDVLDVRIPENPNHDREVQVAPDGSITLDLLGGVPAGGRTVSALAQELKERYAKFLRRASPTVSLKSARPEEPEEVVVVGPAPRAGRLALAGGGTLLDVLGDAGYGGKLEQTGDRLSILRGGRSLSLWARDVLALGDPRWNVKLRPKDVVVIHLPEQVAVTGEVQEPGAVALPRVGVISVVEALTRAGGVKDTADVQNARIIREWGRRSEPVDLNAVLFAGAPEPPPLTAGDTLSIPAGKATKVFVFGMVEKPGLQRFSGRVHLVEAVSGANPKQFGAVLDDAKLVRGWPDAPQVIAIDLDRLLLEHDASLNVELRDGDVVYIPESLLSDTLDVLERLLNPLGYPAFAAAGFFKPR